MAKKQEKRSDNQRHYHSGTACRAGSMVLQSFEQPFLNPAKYIAEDRSGSIDGV